MKLTKKFLSALLVCAAAELALCCKGLPLAALALSGVTALYFSTDDGDAYDAQWLAILDTKVEGKVSIGDCYSYKLQNGGWDITDWNNMDLLPTPAFQLLNSADVTMVGISFTNEGGVVLLPY